MRLDVPLELRSPRPSESHGCLNLLMQLLDQERELLYLQPLALDLACFEFDLAVGDVELGLKLLVFSQTNHVFSKL